MSEIIFLGVKTPEEMVGKWKVKYTNNWENEYLIAADRLVTNMYNGVTQSFKRSDNQDKFPSCQGWYLWRNLHRAAAWDYVRLGSDGLLETHHFCTDEDGCKSKLNGVGHYCCVGSGRKEGGSPLEINSKLI